MHPRKEPQELRLRRDLKHHANYTNNGLAPAWKDLVTGYTSPDIKALPHCQTAHTTYPFHNPSSRWKGWGLYHQNSTRGPQKKRMVKTQIGKSLRFVEFQKRKPTIPFHSSYNMKPNNLTYPARYVVRTLPSSMTCEQFLNILESWNYSCPKDYTLTYYVQGNQLYL